MNKEQYARLLKDIRDTHKQGGDVSAHIANYKDRFKYIYIYNDSIFKLLFGAPENESVTIDFFNAMTTSHIPPQQKKEHLADINN